MSRDHDALKRTFDGVADLYDQVRPVYGEDFFDDLFSLAGFSGPAFASKSPDVLEVGCGTGQASVSLARRGCKLVCVELGENLAAVARKNLAEYPSATVEVAGFEDWDSGGRQFDMVFSICAWHWIDPARGYAKAASLLRPGGVLAIASVTHVFPEGFDPFFTEAQDCYDAVSDDPGSWRPRAPEEIPDDRAAIEASGLFGEVHVKHLLWRRELNADQFVGLLGTFSDHIAMHSEKREWLFARLRERIALREGGVVRKDYLTILHVARVL